MPYVNFDKLLKRRVDPSIRIAGVNEAYQRIANEDPAIRYLIGAMQPIDPAYTKTTITERDRVESQLQDGLAGIGQFVSFDYQGSVTNDTHIKAHSDIDLLVVDDRSFSVEPPNKASSPYQGNPIEDLRQIRKHSASILQSAFPAAKVDQNGGKAVNIAGGSLRRKIDVIPCNFWHTVEYLQTGEKDFLGIKILDNDSGRRIPNKPFLHNRRIHDRDSRMNGGLRKLIRLLKSLKYDSDDLIDITSYDLAGIVYNMSDQFLLSQQGQDLVLAKNCHIFLMVLESSPSIRQGINVPNEMRKVFSHGGANEKGLKQIRLALGTLLQEVELGLSRSFRKLAEARINY